jgi:cytochrome P450
MSTAIRNERLEEAFKALSANYRGTDIDLYAVCRDRRANSPVMTGDFMNSIGVPTHAGTTHGNPTFTLFKYNDIKTVLQDAATYTSGFIAKGFGSFFSADGLIILAMDGDPHRAARGLLQPAFAPQAMLPWRHEIEKQIRDEFIVPLVPQKKADLLDFGLYFPIRVIYGLIGFPDSEMANFYEYAAMGLSILAGPQLDPMREEASRARAMKATNTLYEATLEQVKRRRAEGATGDDLITRLMNAEYEGHKLDDHEVATFARSMLPAGGETTTRTFSAIMTFLLTVPGLIDRVRNDRALVSKLIDEAVRFEPCPPSRCARPLPTSQIGDVLIPKGSFVQCMVASANRDESAFENPDVFDIDRRQKPSFGFGFGPHMCIGQFVAKLELNCADQRHPGSLPQCAPRPRASPHRRSKAAHLRGAKSVHVIWDC